MKRILLVLTILFFSFIACNNTTDVEYKDQIIVGTAFQDSDTLLLVNVGSEFGSYTDLYVRVTFKDESSGKQAILKIQKENGTIVEVVDYQKKIIQEYDKRGAIFFVKGLPEATYYFYLFREKEPNYLVRKSITIF